MSASNPYRVRAKGPLACFTRPEMKGERVSYEVMTPSAARGVLEAICWKPAIRWRVHAIEVLNPVRWTSIRRNEVNSKVSTRMRGPYFADEDRAQRNTVALKDVDYVITASFSLTERAGDSDTVGKFHSMFMRRLERGQCWQQPYLGCREMAADVELAGKNLKPIDSEVERPLGWMFWDFDYRDIDARPDDEKAAARPMFFEARLAGGVLKVPGVEDVRQVNAAATGQMEGRGG